MTEVCDLLAEALELGRNEDQSEVLVRGLYLELLEHFGQKQNEVFTDMQVVNDDDILLP